MLRLALHFRVRVVYLETVKILRTFPLLAAILGALSPFRSVHADEILVAVAANFSAPMQAIAREFEAETGHHLRLSFGATGKFYAQIVHGAPFDVLLAADDETPARLVKEGLAYPGTTLTYAIGRLVLWAPRPDAVDGKGDILRRGNFTHLALANPKTAPYGNAAMQTLTALGLLPALQARFVQGENVAQTYQFVASGNAELGFLALAQVWKDGKLTSGSAWIVPNSLHQPIRQDALAIKRTGAVAAAAPLALLAYLKGEKARSIIKSYGYE